MRPAFALALVSLSLLASPALAGGDGAKGGSKAAPAPAPKADADGKDWSKHKGDIPFIVGREAGMKEVEFTGKPVMFFYTATW